MDDNGRSLVETMHRQAIEQLAGRPPTGEPAAIPHTELAEAKPDDVFFHEWNTYRKEVGSLLAEGHEGRFILIKKDAIVGIFDYEETALAEGAERFPGRIGWSRR